MKWQGFLLVCPQRLLLVDEASRQTRYLQSASTITLGTLNSRALFLHSQLKGSFVEIVSMLLCGVISSSPQDRSNFGLALVYTWDAGRM